MRIALISSKGGTGKTTTAVALACHWARQTPTLLIDCDPQDTGSAQWWLNRTDGRLAELEWAKAAAKQTAQTLRRINPDRHVVIDTRPSVHDEDILRITRSVDLVIIPGSTFEAATIAQTAGTVKQARGAPTVAVLTKTATQSADTAATSEMREALATAGCPVVGTIRRYMALEAAAVQGRRPEQLAGMAGKQINSDVKALAGALTRTLKENSK